MRKKLELEVYSDDGALIEYFAAKLTDFLLTLPIEEGLLDNFSLQISETTFNPEKFFKMCRELEEKYYARNKK